jgi:peptidoglycan hydrolase CwlO-like protein
MSKDKELDDMSYTQLQGDLGPLVNDMNNKLMQHTQDITRLKTQNENIFAKLDGMESKVDSIGDKIDQGNEKNEKIFNQLLEHHLGIKQSDNANKWKLLTAILGGGGLISGIAIALISLF